MTFAGDLAAQSQDWRSLTLGYGIHMDIPGNWRVDDSTISIAVRSGKRAIDAAKHRADESGHLFIVATPSGDVDGASLSIQILPTRVSQADLTRMTAADIRAGEENYFRPEAEKAAKKMGVRITLWNGTSRRTIGGRLGLLTSYLFKYPNGQEMLKQTFSVYLGTRGVHIHVFRPAGADHQVLSAIDRMIQSLYIAVDSL